MHRAWRVFSQSVCSRGRDGKFAESKFPLLLPEQQESVQQKRKSEAITGAPDSVEAPLMMALGPSMAISAPIRCNSHVHESVWVDALRNDGEAFRLGHEGAKLRLQVSGKTDAEG